MFITAPHSGNAADRGQATLAAERPAYVLFVGAPRASVLSPESDCVIWHSIGCWSGYYNQGLIDPSQNAEIGQGFQIPSARGTPDTHKTSVLAGANRPNDRAWLYERWHPG